MNELDIWRAAQQMLKLHPDGDAWLAASMRADAAFDQGDTFNFALWKRITKAVQELERRKPNDGEALN